MRKCDYTWNIMMLGDAKAGKASLVIRYTSGFFLDDLKLTSGVDHYSKIANYKESKVKLQIWPFRVDERSQLLLQQHNQGANAALFLYNITIPNSLDLLLDWTQTIRECAGDIPIMLVGTIDQLEKQRAVSREEGIQAAKKHNFCAFIEVSSKTGQNVQKTFDIIIEMMIKRQVPKANKAKHIHEPLVIVTLPEVIHIPKPLVIERPSEAEYIPKPLSNKVYQIDSNGILNYDEEDLKTLFTEHEIYQILKSMKFLFEKHISKWYSLFDYKQFDRLIYDIRSLKYKKYDKMDKCRKKVIESAITTLKELQSIQSTEYSDPEVRRVFKNIYSKYKDLIEFSLKEKASNIHIQFYRLITLLKIFVELTNWYFEGEESVHKFSRLAWEDGMTEKEYEKYVISEDIDLYIRDGGIYVDFSGYSYDDIIPLLPLEFNDSLRLALKKKYIRGYPTWIKELRDSL